MKDSKRKRERSDDSGLVTTLSKATVFLWPSFAPLRVEHLRVDKYADRQREGGSSRDVSC